MKNEKIMRKRKYFIYILFVWLTAALVFLHCGSITAHADEMQCREYTNVLTDLAIDPDFSVANYPLAVTGAHTLQLATIAESEHSELFVYVYHRRGDIEKYPACRIVMQANLDTVQFRVYELQLINHSETLGKYLVKDFKVSNAIARYYGIPELFRAFNAEIDEDIPDGATTTYKAFDVSKQFTAITALGKVTYTCTGMETVTMTDMYSGIIRYNNGFTLNNSKCDSHYLAFATDKRIDRLISAEVTFEPVDYEFKSVYSFNPWHALINTFKPGTYDDTETTLTETSRGREYRNLLSSDHVSYKGKGWFAKRYEYDRIEKASDFIANESLEPMFEERLQGMQYVLRYAETEFTAVNNTGGSTGSTISFSSGTKMKDTAVLALTFETDEQIHNVGVVGDMRTEDPDPGNTDTNDYNFDITDPDVFPVWARVLVVFIVIIVILILIAVFAPQVLPPLFHGVGVVVSAPFKLIGAAVQSAKKASEARKERKEELEAEKDREEARKERVERKRDRERAKREREVNHEKQK